MAKTAVSDSPSMNYRELKRILAASNSDKKLFQAIVNAPFRQPVAAAFMFLGIVVLLQADRESGQINRVALSNTELAKNTTEVSYLPFEEIKIPLDHSENIISATINSGKPHDTTDWHYLFTPALSPEQARTNQASGGIAYSAVYPLKARQGGALIFSYFQYISDIGEAQQDFMQRYSQIVDNALC